MLKIKEMEWQRSKEVKSNGMYRKVAIWGKWENNRWKSNYETYLESKRRQKCWIMRPHM